jgi:hypothetical protein
MSVKELRKTIKKIVDRLPEGQLASLSDIVAAMDRPPIMARIRKAEKDFRAGRGKNWREIRGDV